MNYNVGDQVIIKDDNCNLHGTILMVVKNGLYLVSTMFGKVVVTGDKIID